MSEKIKGIAASDGYAIAKVYSLEDPDLSYEEIKVEDVEAEKSRFDEAVKVARVEIESIYETARENIGEEEAEVFQAHLMMIDDPDLLGQIKTTIENEEVNAEKALSDVSGMFIQTFEAMEDNAYMQERAADVRDISERILAKLLGVKLADPTTINEEVIVVARDLTPSDTAQLNKKYVKGFITDIGGRTSHSAIMARSLEIPAVVGTKEITQKATEDELIILDGMEGVAILEPSQAEIDDYREKAENYADYRLKLEELKDVKAKSKDGVEFDVMANIGTPKDIEGALANGAEGVGLYRTEFLYMDSDEMPSEEDQFQAYKKVLEDMAGKPVLIRTMDIGGDKELPYLEQPEEMNPFLGYRAIRISLEETGMFKTQLRALLRASVYGKLQIMFPMIATVEEFRQAKAILEEVRADLKAEGIEVADDIEVGIMIEIPAAAVMADKLAKEVDFFSIGTNDLIQYTMAADRMNERVSYLYQPYNPAVLRLIKFVIEAAHAEGKWCGMCGEVAGDQTAVPILMGLGLDEFSMSASSILKTKDLMSKLDTKDMKELAEKATTEAASQEEVVSLVEEYTK